MIIVVMNVVMQNHALTFIPHSKGRNTITEEQMTMFDHCYKKYTTWSSFVLVIET